MQTNMLWEARQLPVWLPRRTDFVVVAIAAAWLLGAADESASGQPIKPRPEPATSSDVRAIPLESNSVDGETSWLIEQEVPRIPKVEGLDRRLPPHIDRRLSYAFDLAQRGATYTADSEFRAVLGMCALELDAQDGGTSHREALRAGWIAIDEADQFSGEQVDWRDSADVRPLAVGHLTPAIQNASVPVDSIQAVQAYYAYAEQRLTYACQGLPGASLAYYGLARTFLVPGNNVSHAAGKSALLHRVALVIAPQNVLAANELGVLLAQHGQLADAQALFQQCVSIDASPETWRNLAVVYARQGNNDASRSALQAGEKLAAQERRQSLAAAHPGQLASATNASSETSESDEKSGLLPKLNFIPKLSNPFRR